MDIRTDRIRALNDDLRQSLLGGLAVMTPGVASLGQLAAIMRGVDCFAAPSTAFA